MRLASGKVWIFILLILGVVVSGLFASRREISFTNEFWTDLFWMGLGIALTTFAVEVVLRHDDNIRQRKRDCFAFRSFTAYRLNLLLRIFGNETDLSEQLFNAALGTNKDFANAVAIATGNLLNTKPVNADLYLQHYGDIAAGLREFAHSYIRLFSSGSVEMASNFSKLYDLASRWNYKDTLSKGFRDYTATLTVESVVRNERQIVADAELANIAELIKETAACYRELVQRAALLNH